MKLLSIFSPKPLSLITKIFFFLIVVFTTQAEDNEYYTKCSKPYPCGLITEIKYPFWGGDRPSYCGVQDYKVICEANKNPIFKMDTQSFYVLNINVNTMTIAREDLFNGPCPPNSDTLDNTFIDTTLVNYGVGTENLTLFYSCPPNLLGSVGEQEKFNCERTEVVALNESSAKVFRSQAHDQGCQNNITVGVMTDNLYEFQTGTLQLPDLVDEGFEVVFESQKEKLQSCYSCEASGGICGTNPSTNQFTCFCKDGPKDESCRGKNSTMGGNIDIGKRSNVRRIIVIGFAALGGAVLIAGVVVVMLRFLRRKGNPITSLWESRDISSYGASSVLDIEKSRSYYGVPVFNYNDLQEATNNFDENNVLGDGGFGIVYKGKLRDGRVVAVKRLYERNFKRVRQFMNEVDILGNLHHQNLVTLYGCTSRNCRELLLVYEYVSNGTVADHLHGEQAKPGSLLWTTRMSIAVETANALSFLHNRDVIHRDVKTNNILLDNNFCVKVADFGLSRLYPTDVTHVSTAPQGTPGYVDPEYHQCYRLTTKSDVYSFGVVLIELISSMPAVDITRHHRDINLSTMAIDKIQNHALHEIVDPHLGFDSDFKVRTMIIGVAELAFQCLQDSRDMRPSMKEVLEILQRISSEDYGASIVEEMEIPGRDNALLKNDPPTMSSDSTNSNKTTPNTSG